MSHSGEAEHGYIGALRRVRDSLLLVVAPITFALLSIVLGYLNSWAIGFDFRGTLWEPSRALLDGMPIHPEPTRDNIVFGDRAAYAPVLILLSAPLAVVPVMAASWLRAYGRSVTDRRLWTYVQRSSAVRLGHRALEPGRLARLTSATHGRIRVRGSRSSERGPTGMPCRQSA